MFGPSALRKSPTIMKDLCEEGEKLQQTRFLGDSKIARRMEEQQNGSLAGRQISLTPAPKRPMPTPRPTDPPPVRPKSKIPQPLP